MLPVDSLALNNERVRRLQARLVRGAANVRLHRVRFELIDTLTRYFRNTNSSRTMYNQTSIPLGLSQERRCGDAVS